jgi:hypothetical protein
MARYVVKRSSQIVVEAASRKEAVEPAKLEFRESAVEIGFASKHHTTKTAKTPPSK